MSRHESIDSVGADEPEVEALTGKRSLDALLKPPSTSRSSNGTFSSRHSFSSDGSTEGFYVRPSSRGSHSHSQSARTPDAGSTDTGGRPHVRPVHGSYSTRRRGRLRAESSSADPEQMSSTAFSELQANMDDLGVQVRQIEAKEARVHAQRASIIELEAAVQVLRDQL